MGTWILLGTKLDFIGVCLHKTGFTFIQLRILRLANKITPPPGLFPDGNAASSHKFGERVSKFSESENLRCTTPDATVYFNEDCCGVVKFYKG